MAMRESEVAVGAEVFHIRFSDSVESGKVIGIKPRNGYNTVKVCLEKSDGWLEIETDKLFATRQEATLYRAMELQQEAAGKLTSAARLFKEAGVMKEKDE